MEGVTMPVSSSTSSPLTTAAVVTSAEQSYNSSPSPSPPQSVTPAKGVHTPCAACKILRRRCDSNRCILSPYFPPTDPLKFTTAHKVFGASNIIKLLQEVPEHSRADAASSMVYEARMRVRDPVYGSAGAISRLQKQVCLLQGELAKSRAEILRLKLQYRSDLVAMLYQMRGLSYQHRFRRDSAAAAAAADVQIDLGEQVVLTGGESGGDEKSLLDLQQVDEWIQEEEMVMFLSSSTSPADLNNNNNNSLSYVCSDNLQQMSPVWEPLWA